MGLSASIALVAAIDGASEVSEVFWNRKPSFDGASGASEVFIRNRKPIFDGASEARVLILEQKAKL